MDPKQRPVSVLSLAAGGKDGLGAQPLSEGPSLKLHQVPQALPRSKDMSAKKEETAFSILRIYKGSAPRRYEPEGSGLSSQHRQQAQPQPDGVCGTPQWSPGSPAQQGPVYQEMSTVSPQQWALQALDRSELQASWFSEGRSREEAEFASR